MTTRDELVAEEQRIDQLRLAAFKTNSGQDRQAYFDAVSKWFQDRHYRRLASRQEVSVTELAQAARDADFEAGQCLETDSSESYERMARALLAKYSITNRTE